MKNISLIHKGFSSMVLTGILMTSSAQAITIEKWSEAYDQTLEQKNYGEAIIGKISTDFSSIGQAKRTYIRNLSVTGTIYTTIDTSSSVRTFSHNQGSGVIGRSLTIWDGSGKVLDGTIVNPNGLGGINLKTDNSTKFIVTLLEAMEFKNSSSAEIIINVYKKGESDPYTAKYTGANAKTAFPDPAVTTIDISIPFTSFKNSKNQGYDFTDVGAISFEIDGTNTSGLDVTIKSIRTDGCQNYVPPVGYGMGYKTVEAKDNNEAKICCDVVDKCGICYGDGSSCRKPGEEGLDCAGVPYGKFVIDDCGECLDPYSEEWNKGLGKFQCTLMDNSEDIENAKNWLKQQRRLLRRVLDDKNYCLSNKRKKKINSKALSAFNGAKAILSSYPSVVTFCQATEPKYCSTASLSVDNEAVTGASQDLLKKTLTAIKARRVCIDKNTSSCETADGCLQRLKRRLAKVRSDKRDAKTLRNNTVKSVNNLPETESICSCKATDK